MPPWRRTQITASAQIKHWFGVHTYVETLYPAFDDGLLTSIATVNECWICGRLA